MSLSGPASTLSASDVGYLKSVVRDIPDFPKPGIVFKDITTALKDARAFAMIVDAIVTRFRGESIASVVCIEARGFVLGSAIAYALGCGMVPVRKKGKLPGKTVEVGYDLEYGRDFLQIHSDALHVGERVLIVDDLLATGGTMTAVVDLVSRAGAEIVGLAFFIELLFLNGRQKLSPRPVFSLIQY